MKAHQLKDAVQDKLPTRRPKRRARLLGRLSLGTVTLALVGTGLRAAYANRYITGSSTVSDLKELSDGRQFLDLENGVQLVIGVSNVSQMPAIKIGAHVTYKVNRLSFDGIPAGEVVDVKPAPNMLD